MRNEANCELRISNGESGYWLELLEQLTVNNKIELDRLKNEASQLVAIMVQSKKTARSRTE